MKKIAILSILFVIVFNYQGRGQCSITINAASDTSFCTGDSVVLNAGTGSTNILDQSQPVDNANYLAETTTGWSFWQSFTPSLSGTLDQVDVGFWFSSAINGTMALEVRSGSGTSGTLLDSVVADLNYPIGDTIVPFNVNAGITAGTVYTFQLIPLSGFPVFYYLEVDYPGSYGGGTMGISNPSGSMNKPVDMVFQTYMAGDTSLTYNWSTGSTNSSITVSTGGTYSLTVNSSGCIDSVSQVVIVNPLPDPSLAIGGNNACVNSQITLNGSPTGGIYSGSDVDSNTFTPNTTGEFPITYTYTDSNHCSNKVSDTVYVLPEPVAGTINATPDTLCAGDTSVLTLSGSTGTIQWQSSSDGISFTGIQGTTSAVYTATDLSQPVYYRVTASGSCGVDTSTIFKLQVNSSPIPIVSTSDSLICSSDSTRINCHGFYASYLWSDGDIRPYTFADAAGNYWVTVTDTNGCSAISNQQPVSVFPVPSVSIIVQGDTLSSFNENAYQWYLNDSVIQGANSSVYTVNQTGSYSVQVTDSNGCTAFSSDKYLAVTGIHELDNIIPFNIYPNPADESITIKINQYGPNGETRIYNSASQLILIGDLRNEQTISVKNLPDGTYSVTLQSGDVSATKEFLVAHK